MGALESANGRRVVRSVVEGLELRRLFATFVVTTTSDGGAGSLRDAITLANADQTPDNIDFNIVGIGVQQIAPLTPLPDIVSPVAINGYSQPGSRANTLAVGSDAKLLVEIHGELGSVPDSAGLHFTMDELTERDYRFANGSSVRGLVFNGDFNAGAIRISSGNRDVEDILIAGNFIGTDAAGTAFAAGDSDGVVSEGQARATQIGGIAPADRNVINGDKAVWLNDDRGSTTIVNNYISLDATGTKSLGGSEGVAIFKSKNNVIGGASAAARNVIASQAVCVSIDADNPFGPSVAMHNRVIGNYLGTTVDGFTRPTGVGNFSTGVEIIFGASYNAIGGATAGEGNVIANRYLGVNIASVGDHDLIRHNSMFNCETAIRLGSGGEFNDPLDTDTGENNQQNYAALISAASTASGTKVSAFLNSRPNASYVVDFFASPNNGNPAKGQAKTFLGSVVVKTDAQGDTTINADLAAAPNGSYLTNTVSTLVDSPFGDTSYVSPAIEIAAAPTPPLPPVTLPTLSVNDVSVTEGNNGTKTLTFTVKLSAAASTAVSVLYATQDGTAKTSDNDYTAKSGTLNFAAGEFTKTVSVTIKSDTKSEIDESFKLLLNSATGATIADGSGVGTIKNDDAAPAKPKLSVGGYTTTEGHAGTKAFSFKVTLDKSSSSSITVKYNTLDDSAKTGSDYASVSGTLTFAAGETSKIVTVYVKGDTAKEGDEKFYLVLTSPTNATIAVGKGTGLIRNDD